MRNSISVLLAVFVLSCQAAPRVFATQPDQKTESATSGGVADPDLLTLRIEPAEAGVRPEARRAIRITLTNVSKQWLWLPYSFGASYETARAILWLRVEAAVTGKSLPWHCSQPAPATSSMPRYLVLAPAASYSVVDRIDCFLPETRAKVRVVAHYHDPGLSPAPVPEFARWFNGRLVSNGIEVDVPDLDDSSPFE